MALADLVIDTNVLAHASNPADGRFHESVEFVNAMFASAAHVCIDEGFDLDEAKNSSLIGQEYLKHLVHGQLGAALIGALAQAGRMRFLSCAVDNRVRQIVTRAIAKPRDRTFVRVAYNSNEQHLVSHDFKDFPNTLRKSFSKDPGVKIRTAGETHGDL